MALRQVSQLQLGVGRATVGGNLVPFSGTLDVRPYHDGAKPLDDQRIIGGAERQSSLGTAGVSATLKQQPRSGEVAILEKIVAALNQHSDFAAVERHSRPRRTLLGDAGGSRLGR